MLSEIPAEELNTAVEMVAREILWEASVDEPPVDSINVASRLGCRILASPRRAQRGSRMRLSAGRSHGGEVILLAPEDRPERRQWSAAHELGELSAHRVFERLAIDPRRAEIGAREQVSNVFASVLLLPRRWFCPVACDLDWDLVELRGVFSTASHELIARRVLDLHPAPIGVTVIDNGDQTWRRGNRWRPPPPCPDELEAWKTCSDLGKPVSLHCRRGGVVRVRAWPVHEPDWKREVLLTEFEDP